ncbi:MAG: B12-binding domain-containing radical SAM protein [Flavobacteriales bacterium]|nr:B12-binding domain-containing radical SAM protein [Flavobacteriales bacterium]
MRIILADSHGEVMGKEQTSPNLSLLYLASYLRGKANFKIDFKYIPQSKSLTYHFNLINRFRPDIYAVSFTSFTALTTYKTIQKIKQLFPNVLVICGGPHVTYTPEEVLKISGADICVIGEGEESFFEIILNYKNKTDFLDNINGIAYLKNGSVEKTPSRKIISDINAIPFPARDLVNNKDYCGLTYSKARPNTEMVVVRGCPQRCVFCANPVFRLKNEVLFRARSPENIVEEVKQLYQIGYREIYLHSDELNVHLKWAVEVCKAISQLNLKDLYFQTNLRVEPISEEFVYWLKKANFWMVRVGIESTSNRVLKGIKKNTDFAAIEKACKLLRKQNIKVFGFMMLFNFWEQENSLQNETTEEVKKSISDIYKLWRKGLIQYSSWAYACPVQGSEFYEIAKKYHLINDYFYPSDTWNSYDFLQGVSVKEFKKLYASARMQQAIMALFSGNYEWRNYKGITRKIIHLIKNFFRI